MTKLVKSAGKGSNPPGKNTSDNAKKAIALKQSIDEKLEAYNALSDEDKAKEDAGLAMLEEINALEDELLDLIEVDQDDETDPEDLQTMKPYFDTYPDEDILHKTSDGQVFLNKDKQWAAYHQKRIDPQTKVQTIKRP